MATPPSSGELQTALTLCSTAFDTEDFTNYDSTVSSITTILDNIADSDTTDPCHVEEALAEVHRFLSSSSNQVMIDALSLDVPVVLGRFACLSGRSLEMVGLIVDCFVERCSARDMLTILGAALDAQMNVSQEPTTYTPFLNGLSKVLLGIQRQHVKQVKIALPIIIRALNDVSSEFSDGSQESLLGIFGAAINIGIAIEAICHKVVEKSKEELCAILCLYVLQIIALITKSMCAQDVSSYCSLVTQCSHLLPFCDLSYLDLLTGGAAAAITSKISTEDSGDLISSLSFVTDGACLAVIWGYISDEVAKAAGEQFTTILDNIRNDRYKRCQAVGMLRYALSSINYSWEIKSHTIDLLMTMMDGTQSEDPSDSLQIDVSSFIPRLFLTLQAIQRVMIGSSDASLRKKAFALLKKIISDLPYSERFDMLIALITHSSSPSMIAILIDLLKVEILSENRQRSLLSKGATMITQNRTAVSPFWSSHVHDLVELVLRPSEGGPPSLPEYIEPVLAALNLYRFVLIIESTGKSNYSGLLSEKMLKKAYSEWLLPLRTLVLQIEAENEKDNSEVAHDIHFALNPVQSVLYRCIELVDDSLKHCK